MTRLETLRQAMKVANVENLLLSNRSNILYLCGFSGEAGIAVLLLTKDKNYFITDGRFTTQAKEETTDYEIIRWEKGLFVDAAMLMESLGLHEVYVDFDDISHSNGIAMQTNTKATLKNAPKLLEDIRKRKLPEEIELTKQACRISDEAFDEILKFIKPGITEQEVCNELEFQMRKRGATTCSFEMIIASGPRGALPHGTATDRIIQKGDMVTMDFGALYKNYRSDMTRTIAVGEPDAKLKEIYGFVQEAQKKAEEGLKAGIISKDLDQLARGVIESHGHKLIHGLGHGIGLDIHEIPFISFRSDYAFEENVIVTLEPGIYVPQLGGIRIEDDYLVTKDGCIQLTHAPKELIIIPVD